jgi:hypothetical protein
MTCPEVQDIPLFKQDDREVKMLQRTPWNRVTFGKFNRASAFPVAIRLELIDKSCCGVSERTTTQWIKYLTFRRFPVRIRRTAGSFNLF